MSTTVVAGHVLNHRPDSRAVVKKARSARALLTAAVTPQPGLARPHVLSILDQGQLGSCTGQGTTQAIRAAQHLVGVTDPPLVARLWAYWLGRSYAHDTANDDGAMIGDVFSGLEKYGLAPETLWPYSDDSGPNGSFKGPPPPEAYRAGFDATFAFRAHRIDVTGDALLEACRTALGQGRLVVFGSAVSNEFCNNEFDATKPLMPPAASDIAGLHCECLGDFGTDGSFDVVNSWNVNWGNIGWWKASSEYLLDSNSSDFWVVDATPTTPLVDPPAGGAT